MMAGPLIITPHSLDHRAFADEHILANIDTGAGVSVRRWLHMGINVSPEFF